MHIIHGLDDLGFKAVNLDDLKRQVEEFYSLYGYKPDVKIQDGLIVVTVDTDLIDKAKKLMENAIDKCNKGRFDEAMSLLEEAQAITPCNGDIYRLKAQIYFMRDKDYDMATDTCIDALRFNPRDYYSLILMGNILMQGKNDSETALSYYEKALEYKPDDEIAATNIATIELQKGNFQRAYTLYKQLIDLDRKYAALYYGLALCCIKMGKLQEAFDIGVKGLKETEDRPENPSVKERILNLTYKVATELIEKVNVKNVFDGVREELEQKLMLPLKVRCDNTMSTYGRLEYGPTHGKHYHVLYYKENSPSNALHTILHEMTHLEMNNDASKRNMNKIMYSEVENYETFCKKNKPFIKKLRSKYGDKAETNIHEMFNMLCLLLMNSPLDLFVEQHIYDKYTTLRAFQFASLYRQSIEYLQSVINPKIEENFPAQIISLVKICNMVTAMHIKTLYGIDTVDQYKPTNKELLVAKDLYEEFLAYSDYKPGEEYDYMDYFLDSLDGRQYLTVINEEDFMQNVNFLNEEIKSTVDIDEVTSANREFAKNHPDGGSKSETMMMSMYMLSALQYFDGMPTSEVKSIAFEIAMLGVKGIDPEKSGYRIKSIDKDFSGYEMLAYYYVSWATAMPEHLDMLQLPFSEAYKLARQLFDERRMMKCNAPQLTNKWKCQNL